MLINYFSFGKQRGFLRSGCKGLSIIEIIIAVTLMSMIVAGSAVAIVGALGSSRLAKEELQATLLAQQGMEAMQSIRNQNWSNLVDGQYGLSETTGSWGLVSSTESNLLNKFDRQITITAVERDDNADIVPTGGTVDEQTKLVTVVVSWDFTPTRSNSVELQQYFTNWQLAEGSGAAGTGPVTITTCSEYCATQGYSSGVCRANANQCIRNNESYEINGDAFCTGGGSSNCCCSL